MYQNPGLQSSHIGQNDMYKSATFQIMLLLMYTQAMFTESVMLAAVWQLSYSHLKQVLRC